MSNDLCPLRENRDTFTSPVDRWITIDSTTIPGSDTELTLSQRNDDFAVRVSGLPGDLMNSRRHHCEDALAELACTRLSAIENAQILIGGSGMGFTLVAVFKTVGVSAEVIVAELVPAVVEWNLGLLGRCAGRPMEDGRTHVHLGDVAGLLIQRTDKFDAILPDIDNGPEPMTHSDNKWLYFLAGLKRIYEKLWPEGIVAIWSARADQVFTNRLKKIGFNVQLRTVRARPDKAS